MTCLDVSPFVFSPLCLFVCFSFFLFLFDQSVHEDVACDGCNACPIVGPRFKCTICPDFDLCEACEQRAAHPHPMIKFTAPEQAAESIHEHVECDVCHMCPIIGTRFKCAVCRNFDMCAACERKDLHDPSHPLLKLREPVIAAYGSRGCCLRVGHHHHCRHQHDEDDSKEQEQEKEEKPDHLKMKFLRHQNDGATSQSGALLAPGREFTKKWLVRNNGSIAWPSPLKLVFISGERMEAKQADNNNDNSNQKRHARDGGQSGAAGRERCHLDHSSCSPQAWTIQSLLSSRHHARLSLRLDSLGRLHRQ